MVLAVLVQKMYVAKREGKYEAEGKVNRPAFLGFSMFCSFTYSLTLSSQPEITACPEVVLGLSKCCTLEFE